MRRKYKRMNRSRGFTMVELLVVIIILGLLTTISIVGIQRVIKNAKDRYYISQEENMSAAARNYAEKSTQYLPKVSGQVVQISLEDLEKTKYIAKVKDYNKSECNEKDSYVQIFKYENEFYYSAYLVCPSYTTNIKERLTKYDPFEVKVEGDINNLNGSFTLKETEQGIVSYSYAIYKDNKQVFQSEQFEVHKTKDKITKKFSLTQYIPGKIKVSVTAVNGIGVSRTESASKNIINDSVTSLKCGTVSGASTTWTTQARTIKVQCVDTGGIGCAKPEFTKKFDSDQKTGTITIYDLEGNPKDCTVNVYIDRTAPTVPTTNLYSWKDNTTQPTSKSGLSAYTAGTWSTKKIYSEPSGSTDALAGGVYYQYKITGVEGTDSDKTASNFNFTKEGVSTISYRACDKVGNCSAYNTASTVKIELNAPNKPTISGGSSDWRKTNRIIWMTSTSNSTSGIKKYQYCYQTSNDSSKCTWIDLSNNTDGVGNGIDVAYYHMAYQDLINAFGGNVNDLVNHYNNFGKSEGRQKSASNWLRTAQNFSEEASKYVFFRAVSNAGLNSAASNSQTLKIDKTPPSCDTNDGSTDWTNKDRNVTVKCKDSTSKCTSSTFSTNFTETQKEGKIQIKDNAGWTTDCEVPVYIDKIPPNTLAGYPGISGWNTATKPTETSECHLASGKQLDITTWIGANSIYNQTQDVWCNTTVTIPSCTYDVYIGTSWGFGDEISGSRGLEKQCADGNWSKSCPTWKWGLVYGTSYGAARAYDAAGNYGPVLHYTVTIKC